MTTNESAPDPTAGEFPQGGRCRQFWRYTGQGEAPEQVAMECNIHGVIEGMTAAASDQTIADAWADHLRAFPATPGANDASERLTEAERLAVREDLWSALAVEPTEPEMNLVERTFLGLIAAREAAAATKARADERRAIRFRVETACDGYENLMDEDVPGGRWTDAASYQSGAADAARAIRGVL